MEAHSIAAKNGGVECTVESNPWLDPKLSTCKELKPGLKPCMIVQHIRYAQSFVRFAVRK